MNTPKPGDFPIGSAESRAAARMLAANRQDTRRRIEIVTNVHMPDPNRESPNPEENWNSKVPHFGPWLDSGDVLMRLVYVPNGMSEEEARRIADGATQ
jgi:hypothetical protein